LPKANFFAELVHSIDDPPVKPIVNTANSGSALATSHPKSSLKVKELRIGMVSNYKSSFRFHYILK
jgi:hypothetical protein